MNTAYKFRLYPTAEQEKLIIKTFGCVRFIYNRMLSDRIKYYTETKKTLNVTPAQYKQKFPWLKEVDSLALTNAQLALFTTYKHFFQDPRNHFPRFKSKKMCRDEYSTNNQKGTVRIVGDKIRLPKLGFVKLKVHRQLPENSTIKTVTITRNAAGKYYIAVLIQHENQALKINPYHFVALAFSKNGMYVTSNGIKEEYPKNNEKLRKRMLFLQKAVRRCKSGSKNQQKTLKRLFIVQEKIKNQNMDLTHKLSLSIARTYDCVFFETLDSRITNNALEYMKSVNFNIWKMLGKYLSYKLERQGKQFLLVSKSVKPRQTCSSCRAYNMGIKSLNIRNWVCSSCGQQHNSDYNTALNLLSEGMKSISA